MIHDNNIIIYIYTLTSTDWCFRADTHRARPGRAHPLLRAEWAGARLSWLMRRGTRSRRHRREFSEKRLSIQTKCPTRTSRRTFRIAEFWTRRASRGCHVSSHIVRGLWPSRKRCSSTPPAFRPDLRPWKLRSSRCTRRCTSPTSNICRYPTSAGESEKTTITTCRYHC